MISGLAITRLTSSRTALSLFKKSSFNFQVFCNVEKSTTSPHCTGLFAGGDGCWVNVRQSRHSDLHTAAAGAQESHRSASTLASAHHDTGRRAGVGAECVHACMRRLPLRCSHRLSSFSGAHRRVTRQRPGNGRLRCWRSRCTRLCCPTATTRAKSLQCPSRGFRASRCPLPPDSDHGGYVLEKDHSGPPFFPCARTDAEQTLATGKYKGLSGARSGSRAGACVASRERGPSRARVLLATGRPDGHGGGCGGGSSALGCNGGPRERGCGGQKRLRGLVAAHRGSAAAPVPNRARRPSALGRRSSAAGAASTRGFALDWPASDKCTRDMASACPIAGMHGRSKRAGA